MKIGIFDSGIGGLTVFRQLMKKLPNSDYVYLGDTARLPYGIKSRKTVIEYSIKNTQFLINKGCDLIVIACNTASAFAYDILRKKLLTRRTILLLLLSIPFVNQIKATSSNCKKTPPQSKGPFYKIPSKIFNNDMTNNGKAIGKKIKVYGKILDNKCKPITNASLDIWQANSFGKYNHKADLSRSRKDNDFFGYMRLLSNEKGEYNFNTILPGSYKVSKDFTRTPHIHFKVTSKQKQLTTQMYFKGNKMNKKDFLFKNTYNNNVLEASIDKSFSNLTYKFDIII